MPNDAYNLSFSFYVPGFLLHVCYSSVYWLIFCLEPGYPKCGPCTNGISTTQKLLEMQMCHLDFLNQNLHFTKIPRRSAAF